MRVLAVDCDRCRPKDGERRLYALENDERGERSGLCVIPIHQRLLHLPRHSELEGDCGTATAHTAYDKHCQ